MNAMILDRFTPLHLVWLKAICIEHSVRIEHANNDFIRPRSLRITLLDTIYQPLRSGRIWHKVNF